VDLAGAVYATDAPDRLALEVGLSAESDGADGVVTARLTSQGLELHSAEGAVAGFSVPFETSVQNVSFPEGSYDVTLREAAVEIVVQNEVEAAAELNATITGRREDGSTVVLVVPANQRAIAPGGSARPVETRIRLDQTNSTIVDLLNLVPTSIEVSGGVTLNDSDARIDQSDGINIGLKFEAPLILALEETVFLTDAEDIGVDDEQVRDRLVTHVGASSISLGLTNHMPIGVAVRMLIGPDPEALLTAPALILPVGGEVLLPAAAVDPATGAVTQAVVDETEIEMTEESIAVFSTTPLYSRVEMRLLGTDGATVRVSEADYAEVRMRARVRLRIDENLDN